MAGSVGQYRLYYGRDIDLFGLSLAKSIAGVSVGGEVNYRRNMPLQSVPVTLLPAPLVNPAAGQVALSAVGTDAPGAEDRFRRIPQVESVTREHLTFTIRGQGTELVNDVIRCLAEHDMRVIDFRTERPTLEDVFLKVTGHSIRG